MKRLISLLLSAAIAGTIGVSTFAAEISNELHFTFKNATISASGLNNKDQITSDADIALAIRGLENFLKQADDETVISGVYILHKEEQEKQKRILFYGTSSVLKSNADGTNETIRKISAPFELYATTASSTGEYLTFCGRLVAPRHFDPADWDDFGVTEENYDPEMHLREDIMHKAPPEIAEQANQFLNLNPRFSEEMWSILFGKASNEVTKQEIVTEFNILKGITSDLQILNMEEHE